jgi:hypothetical protein
MVEFILGTCRSRHGCNGGGHMTILPFKKLYTAVGKLFIVIVEPSAEPALHTAFQARQNR